MIFSGQNLLNKNTSKIKVPTSTGIVTLFLKQGTSTQNLEKNLCRGLRGEVKIVSTEDLF